MRRSWGQLRRIDRGRSRGVRNLFPADEYAGRRARLTEELSRQALDLAIVTHVPDIFYLSGTCQASYLFLNPSGYAWLAVRRGADRTRAETQLPLEEFADSAQLSAAVSRNAESALRRVGLAFDVTRHDTAMRLWKILARPELVDLGAVFKNLRIIKSPREVELIRLAGRQLDGAFKTAASLLRLGQSELELAIRIEAYLRRKGHPGQVRVRSAGVQPPVGFILTGASTQPASEFDAMCTGPGLSPAVPLGPGDREFHAGEPVLFDYCGCCAGYLADESRMLSLGRPPEEASWAYEAMRHVLRRLENQLGPGQVTGQLYETALREARILGYEEQFLNPGRSQLQFVGHGLGLELDEPPFLARGRKESLAPGMVVAIEPKVLLPGVGVIGVENTYLITADGYERLTQAEEDWRQVPLD